MPIYFIAAKKPSKMSLAAALALSVFWAQGQSVAAASGAMPQSNDVILNVTALDERGDPVTDLARDDFQILEDGKPQSIASFQAGAAKPAAETPPPATVILFDLLNSNGLNRVYVSTFIVRSLEPLETADTVFLYILTNHGEFYAVHGFPTLPQAPAVERVKGSQEPASAAAPPWTKQIHPLLHDAIEKVYGIRPMDDWDPGYRAGITFLTLSKLQEAFKAVPGPKTIVWISSGVTNWPDYPHGCREDMTISSESGSYIAGKCTHTCRRQTMCIDYEPFFQRFSAELGRTNTLMYTAEDLPSGAIPPTNRGTSADTLRQLADLTGGRLYTDMNMDKAITDSIKNARGRYQIAIAAAAPNGKHHKLRVECARKGVRVEGPRGYFATEP